MSGLTIPQPSHATHEKKAFMTCKIAMEDPLSLPGDIECHLERHFPVWAWHKGTG